MSESNDGIAFATVTEEKQQKKSKKKKEITCFRCKKMGHYSNECKEELPKMTEGIKGLSLLINIKDSSDKEPISEDQYNSEQDNNVT